MTEKAARYQVLFGIGRLFYSLSVSLLKIACPEVYIRVHFWTRVFAEQKRRRCVKPRTSLSVLKLQGANKNKAEAYL